MVHNSLCYLVRMKRCMLRHRRSQRDDATLGIAGRCKKLRRTRRLGCTYGDQQFSERTHEPRLDAPPPLSALLLLWLLHCPTRSFQDSTRRPKYVVLRLRLLKATDKTLETISCTCDPERSTLLGELRAVKSTKDGTTTTRWSMPVALHALTDACVRWAALSVASRV